MSENILAQVPGPYIAAALQTLPKAETATVNTMEAVVDVPGIGMVRVTAKRFKGKHCKMIVYFWTPRKAVALDQCKTPPDLPSRASSNRVPFICGPLAGAGAMEPFAEETAVRGYLRLMHELAKRVDLVAHACNGELNLSPPYAREYCYLQFRRICELVALGCLQLHGDLPAARSSAAKKEWNAQRIMSMLQKNHPHSFPQSHTSTKTTDLLVLEANLKPNALTFAEFKALYSKCGEILHRGTIRSIEAEGQIGKPQYDEIIHWSRKLVDLLNEHVVARANGNGFYHIFLKTESGAPACHVLTGFPDRTMHVATYNLEVREGDIGNDARAEGDEPA